MLDIEKIKKAPVISRRMAIIDYLCKLSGLDIYYLFSLLNMYNAKNKGRWFWQKASFTGFLKDDFNNFNNFMDKFSSQFRTMDEGKINSSLDEANRLLVKLVSDLEASMLLNRETDRIDILSYLDDNIKSLVDQSLKAVKS